MIRPYGDYILVTPHTEDSKIKEVTNTKPVSGKVYTDHKDFKTGDIVFYIPFAGQEIELLSGEKITAIKLDDIVGYFRSSETQPGK